MSDNIHLVWLGVAAIAVAAVLTIGTLAAADLLPTRKREPAEAERAEEEVSSPAAGSASRRA